MTSITELIRKLDQIRPNHTNESLMDIIKHEEIINNLSNTSFIPVQIQNVIKLKSIFNHLKEAKLK